MAFEQYFEEAVAHNPVCEGKNFLEKCNNPPDAVSDSDNNPSGGFDCNICLDSVQDPVVTLCGHLYCWPCIYKWLHYQTISTENQGQKQQHCPVCKSEVSHTTLVPLYGGGLTNKASRGKTPQFDIVIPKRPLAPTCGVGTVRSPNTSGSQQFPLQLHHGGHSYQPQIYYPQQGGYPASPMIINVLDPVSRTFGDMVYTGVFGNSINLYTYPNSYNLVGSTSPRIRRHVMQADKSLSRISFFLFCCIVLCLLLF
ncbi:E3 ubiquitin-protein ligase RMA1H1-like [Durio zibethinus]|uniref:E3 ubiquitin-protein ligase RMA n=1 Tax=Durio zibethinus TaxID=66656 RepID=A0A6P6AGZ0_DURZI|nr:E3 ubiquitin-protein ligase RMA1H1-like [Durio zibethinus]XP_022764056.1 E3 ubiquitin-protein ligase RMA1H1-like [Durio zibethinus]XP_022764058.1 E3 ubiquitin-protein ligase RMA1H1-like [Durio zibethinus]XP_022764059.1 E3 ubiquitin-protein ligase RMA1H1-like [Durio zibethinus]